MTPNIIYLDNAFWKTDLEEWPEKPKEPIRHWTKTGEWERYEDKLLPKYNEAITEARTHLTPIVEEDWEKVERAIRIRVWIETSSMPKSKEFKLVNGTIYKDTGIELEEVIQVKRGDGKWFASLIASEIHIKEYPSTYRKAYRIEEGEQPKEESQEYLWDKFIEGEGTDIINGQVDKDKALKRFHITRKTL